MANPLQRASKSLRRHRRRLVLVDNHDRDRMRRRFSRICRRFVERQRRFVEGFARLRAKGFRVIQLGHQFAIDHIDKGIARMAVRRRLRTRPELQPRDANLLTLHLGQRAAVHLLCSSRHYRRNNPPRRDRLLISSSRSSNSC